MATKKLVQNVRSGYSEYSVSMWVTGNGDTLEVEFNAPFVVDELIADYNEASEIKIVYPASGANCTIKNAENGAFALNDYNGSKKWYRLPANGKIQFVVTSYTSDALLQATIVGRA